MTDFRHLFDNARDARDFMLAGNSTVTLVSRNTGARFTYRVRAPEQKRGSVSHFVNLMNGPDNERNFVYLGLVRDPMPEFSTYQHGGHKAKVAPDAPSAKAFAWAFFQIVEKNTIPPSLEVWSNGRCGRCNRKLTVPSSIARGLGPECASRGE